MTPIDQLLCRIDIRQAHGSGIYQPVGLQPIIGHPAFDGVTDWGGAAVDPVRGVMTVNTMEMPFKIWLMRRDDPPVAPLMAQKKGGENAREASLQTQYNAPYVAVVKAWIGLFGTPCSAPPWGHLTAVDLKMRQALWREVLGGARHRPLRLAPGATAEDRRAEPGRLDRHRGRCGIHRRDHRPVPARL